MAGKELATTVAIDHKASVYLEYMEKRRTVEALTKQMEKLKGELRDAIGDHEEATIFGDTVITNRPINRLKAKELESANPTLYKEFLMPKLVEVFDTEAFQAEHPNLYRQYQSRQFLLKEK